MTTPKMKDADLPLRDRIEAAMERIRTGQVTMRVPVEATDPDVVLADCLAELDAARAKDAEAHAAALAAKDAEIARLRAQVDEDAHLRSIVELYRSDPMAMADALWRMRDDLGRLRSVVEEPHDVPPEERDRP